MKPQARGAVPRRAEDKARELQRAGVDGLDEIFLLCDAAARIVFFNLRFAEAVGGGVAAGERFEDVIRKGVALGRFPESAGREEAWIGAWIAARRAGNAEIELQCGERRYLVKDRHMPGGALVSVGFDITERKRAESESRASEQRFRALVDLSSDWYWVTDAEHRFTVREGDILRRMALPSNDDYGRTRWELGFSAPDAAGWDAHRAMLERHEEFRDLLTARAGRDGITYWATISGRPLFDAAGGFIGYHGTGRDVTTEVEAEHARRRLNTALEEKVAARTAELAAAMRELEAFAYSVSHDLRAPLRGIDGFSHVLLSSHAARLDPEGRRLLQRIRAGTQRMGRLIGDLLELSQVSRAAVRSTRVDLTKLVRGVIDELTQEKKERAVDWRVAPGMRVRGDARLLRIALANLIGNSLKFSRDSAPARIEIGRLADAGGNTEFFVRDNGAGFDMTYAANLFKPFQRLHGMHEFEGSGIGLATVQRVIAKHGGRIRGEGSPGGGATFYFTFPDQ